MCRSLVVIHKTTDLALLRDRYSYYDQLVSLRMLPLQRMVLWTRRLRAEVFKTSGADPRIVFAGLCQLRLLSQLQHLGT